MLFCLLILMLVCSTFVDSTETKCLLNREQWIKTLTQKFQDSCPFSVTLEYRGWLEHFGLSYAVGWIDGKPVSERIRILNLDYNPCSTDVEMTKHADELLSEIDKKNSDKRNETCKMFHSNRNFGCVPLKLPNGPPRDGVYSYRPMVYCSFTNKNNPAAFNISKAAAWEIPLY